MVLETWSGQLEALLADDSVERCPLRAGAAVGPKLERAWWRARAAHIASVVEQLKGRDARMVVAVVSAAKSRLLKRWRQNERALADALHEAEENAKHLAELELFFEPLYTGSAAQMLDAAPGLFAGVRMLATSTRHYSTARALARLVGRVAAQVAAPARVGGRGTKLTRRAASNEAS